MSEYVVPLIGCTALLILFWVLLIALVVLLIVFMALLMAFVVLLLVFVALFMAFVVLLMVLWWFVCGFVDGFCDGRLGLVFLVFVVERHPS